VVWLLLTRSDVQADSKDREGRTLLSHAAREGHEALIKLLLARSDIAPYLTDDRGRTPLSHAAEGRA
jgi:ankyrin repeat protein